MGTVAKLCAKGGSNLLRFRLPTAHGEARLVVESSKPRHEGRSSKVSHLPWVHAVCTRGA